jgi:DNA-binding response OmpR family regulator
VLRREEGKMAKILIIDDKQYVRELLMEELIDEGYVVETTADAESIKELITTFKTDMILLDLYMNGKDRWDVLSDIRQQYPQLPILLITASDSYSKDPRLSQTDGYVIKSMYFDELKQKITEILQGKIGQSRERTRKGMLPQFNIAPSM